MAHLIDYFSVFSVTSVAKKRGFIRRAYSVLRIAYSVLRPPEAYKWRVAYIVLRIANITKNVKSIQRLSLNFRPKARPNAQVVDVILGFFQFFFYSFSHKQLRKFAHCRKHEKSDQMRG